MSTTDTDEVGPSSGSGAGLIAFLNSLIRKNEMVDSTASALRTGCRKVLEIEASWQDLDMRTLDVESLLLRFRNKYRGDLAERSISNYEQRFRSTVEMYRRWLADDPAWRPRTRPGATVNSGRRGPLRASGPGAEPDESSASNTSTESSALTGGPTMVTYPLPLRPGVQVRLVLPEDLTLKEAQRVSTFVSALAFEERLAITAGAQDS